MDWMTVVQLLAEEALSGTLARMALWPTQPLSTRARAPHVLNLDVTWRRSASALGCLP